MTEVLEDDEVATLEVEFEAVSDTEVEDEEEEGRVDVEDTVVGVAVGPATEVVLDPAVPANSMILIL